MSIFGAENAMPNAFAKVWEDAGLGGEKTFPSSLIDEPDVAWRFKKLGLLPEGTLGREFWNQGYATEAAAACRDRAFAQGLTRVISLIAAENRASIRVAEKIGETFEREVLGGLFRIRVVLYSLNRPAR